MPPPDSPAPYLAEAVGRTFRNTGAVAKVAQRLISSRGRRIATVNSRLVDPFALVLLGGLIALIVWIWLLGKYYPGSGLEQLGLRSAREITETREQLDAEDLDQMLAAANARRRARGEREVTVNDLEMQVHQDVVEQRRRREDYLADRELDQLLEVTNARRRARGLPERSRAEARAEFGSAPKASSAEDQGPKKDPDG